MVYKVLCVLCGQMVTNSSISIDIDGKGYAVIGCGDCRNNPDKIKNAYQRILSEEELAYLEDHMFIGIRENETTNQRPVQISFETYLTNDEPFLTLKTVLQAAIAADEDWKSDQKFWQAS